MIKQKIYKHSVCSLDTMDTMDTRGEINGS